MMVSCDNCGKEYSVREDQLSGEKTRFKCANCGNHFVVMPMVPSRPAGSVGQEPDASKASVSSVRFGLIFKVVSLMLLVSLVPLSTFWWINFNQSNTRTKQDTEVLIGQITQGLSDHVDEWIDKNIRILNALAHIDDIKSMRADRQTPLLKAASKEYPWTYLMFTINVYGANVARNDGKRLRNYADRSYFKQVIQGRQLAWQSLIGKTSKKPALVLAVPIKERGRVVGVLASAMTIDDISERIATWRRGETGYAFLVDENGKVVAHQVRDFVLKQKNLSDHPLVSRILNGNMGTHYFEDQTGKAYIGNILRTRYGWGMAVQQSEKEVFEALSRSQRLAYMMLAITIVVVFIVALLLGRAIVVPIRKLTHVAERISKGDLEARVEIDTKDEIAVLGNAISRLQDSMRLSIERFSRRKKSRR